MSTSKYIEGIGRRKTATARVRAWDSRISGGTCRVDEEVPQHGARRALHGTRPTWRDDGNGLGILQGWGVRVWLLDPGPLRCRNEGHRDRRIAGV